MSELKAFAAFAESFLSGPWTVAIGLALAVLGIALSVKSIRAKKPVYFARSRNLITDYSSNLTKLKVLYDERQVSDITITKVAFWNAGKETIRGVDLTETDSLRITIDGNPLILDVSVIAANNAATNFSASLAQDSRCVILAFQFLDENQGAAVQIIHSGSQPSGVRIAGTIMGSKGIKRAVGRNEIAPGFSPSRELSRYFERTSNILSSRTRRLLLGLFAFAMPFVPLIAEFYNDPSERMELWKLLAMFTFIAVPYWHLSYSMVRNVVPKGLEVVED